MTYQLESQLQAVVGHWQIIAWPWLSAEGVVATHVVGGKTGSFDSQMVWIRADGTELRRQMPAWYSAPLVPTPGDGQRQQWIREAVWPLSNRLESPPFSPSEGLTHQKWWDSRAAVLCQIGGRMRLDLVLPSRWQSRTLMARLLDGALKTWQEKSGSAWDSGISFDVGEKTVLAGLQGPKERDLLVSVRGYTPNEMMNNIWHLLVETSQKGISFQVLLGRGFDILESAVTQGARDPQWCGALLQRASPDAFAHHLTASWAVSMEQWVEESVGHFWATSELRGATMRHTIHGQGFRLWVEHHATSVNPETDRLLVGWDTAASSIPQTIQHPESLPYEGTWEGRATDPLAKVQVRALVLRATIPLESPDRRE